MRSAATPRSSCCSAPAPGPPHACGFARRSRSAGFTGAGLLRYRKDQTTYWAVLDGRELPATSPAIEAGGACLWERTFGALLIWHQPVATRRIGMAEATEPVPLREFLTQVHDADRPDVGGAWQRGLHHQGELRIAFRSAARDGRRWRRLVGLFEFDRHYRPVRLTGVLQRAVVDAS